MRKTYGRTTILAPYTEKELASLSGKALDNVLIDILNEAMSIHMVNKNDIQYLKSYYYGDQDIKYKIKKTREDINNKITENWAYAMIDFKKTYLLGNPIQYVKVDESSEEELSTLNSYVEYEEKQAKDMEIYEDVLVTGHGFRYVNKDNTDEEDEAPFELVNCPVEDTEIVYSSKLGNEQLFAFICTDMMDFKTPSANDQGEVVVEKEFYHLITVYLRNRVITYSDQGGIFRRVPMTDSDGNKVNEVPLIYKQHLITEYYTNRKRISLIELGKDLLDQINNLESLDADDLEQFVNSILVFTNASVKEEDLKAIEDLGAVSISSDDNRKASVDLIEGKLSTQETQTNYDRLLNALHQILGIPRATDAGTETTGDTGKSKLTGQGFVSSGIRARGDETFLKRCDKASLRTILAICREIPNSGIKDLKAKDIDNKFQRDMSDNLLTKTQALQNLYSCDIPRDFANAMVNLFPDPHAVTSEQENLFGEQQSQLNQGFNSGTFNDTDNNTQPVDKANEQNNDIRRAEQSDVQSQ